MLYATTIIVVDSIITTFFMKILSLSPLIYYFHTFSSTISPYSKILAPTQIRHVSHNYSSNIPIFFQTLPDNFHYIIPHHLSHFIDDVYIGLTSS
jgi:hypothetical protein